MTYITVPSLKRPNNKKEFDEWIKSITQFVSGNMSLYTSKSVRSSTRDKIINLDLYNGKLHMEDIVSILNPSDLKTIDASKELQHFPTAAPIIDLLVGEEINREFEPIVDITNNIGIEEKRERLREYVKKEMDKLEEKFQGDEESLAIEIKRFKRYLKFTYKDIKEKKASALLEKYWNTLDLETKFIEGFRQMWCTGEEGYSIDLVNGDIVFQLLNAANVRLYGGGRSNRYSDYDLIVVEDHFSPGYLIDRYGSKLSDEEVERILNYQTSGIGLGVGEGNNYGNVTHEFVPVGDILGSEISDNYIDDTGNIRHLRIRFKAYKKVKKVLYQDEDGVEQEKVRSYKYRVREGEALKETVWITEWMIATLIGADIITDVSPIAVKFPKMNSISEGHPGVVGRVYNLNERTVNPPMSKIRTYQYLFDVTMENLMKAMSKNVGPILEMDFAKKPSKWSTLKWLGYMFKYNTKFVDSFKEVNKGPAIGQLAGNLASGKDQIQSFDFGNYISQLINILEYLEKSMGDTLGVVPQRLGAVQNRESVGGVERATAQSSHITEWYFYTHTQVKLEALNLILEFAQVALRDNPQKLKYTLDKKILDILDVTEDDLSNLELGVVVTDSKKSAEYNTILRQSAQALMQNGGEFSFVFDILNSNSMAERRRMIEDYEEEKKEAAQQEAQNERQAFEANQEYLKERDSAEFGLKQAALDKDKYIAELKGQIELEIASMESSIKAGDLEIKAHRSLEDIKNDILKTQTEMEKVNNDFTIATKEVAIKEKDSQTKRMQVSNNNKQTT